MEQTDTVQLFKEWEGKSGVYFLSPFYDPEQPYREILVKVGRSCRNMNNRLDSYLLCYPYGYYLFGLLKSPCTQVSQLEELIHSYLKQKKRVYEVDHSHADEWFHLTPKHIHSIFEGLRGRKKSGAPIYVCANGMLQFTPPVLIRKTNRIPPGRVKPMAVEEKENFDAHMNRTPPVTLLKPPAPRVNSIFFADPKKLFGAEEEDDE